MTKQSATKLSATISYWKVHEKPMKRTAHLPNMEELKPLTARKKASEPTEELWILTFDPDYFYGS